MAITTRFRMLRAPEATVDGSLIVKHDIMAIFSEDGVDWFPVPSHHKEICIPANELDVVLSMPHGNAAERQAKIQAYKDLILLRRAVQPIAYPRPPVSDWSKAGIEAYVVAYREALETINGINTDATATAEAANTFITVTLNQSFEDGVDFAL